MEDHLIWRWKTTLHLTFKTTSDYFKMKDHPLFKTTLVWFGRWKTTLHTALAWFWRWKTTLQVALAWFGRCMTTLCGAGFWRWKATLCVALAGFGRWKTTHQLALAGFWRWLYSFGDCQGSSGIIKLLMILFCFSDKLIQWSWAETLCDSQIWTWLWR